jgi:cyclopropane-fatty-acyl-phospholipid synthase
MSAPSVLIDENRETSLDVPWKAIEIFNTLQMFASEAYINGLEIPDFVVLGTLKPILSVLYRNFHKLFIPYDWVVRESEKLTEDSQHLMQIQYNLPTDLFRLMTEESPLIYPKYSVGLWDKGAATLEQAQKDMLDDLIEKAGITDSDEILDLGCGWGSAANYILSRFPNARVTGVNLSRSQCDYLRQKMQDPNSYLGSGRFNLIERDFNELYLTSRFDKIITIGFFEHVGNLTRSFQKMAEWLKKDGKVFLHIISTHLPHNAYSPFIDKYIFPRMRVWSYDAPLSRDRDLKAIAHWYLNGYNYGKTLRWWLKNFDAHQEQLQQLDYGIVYEKFRRIWRLYLLWCIAYFEAGEGKIFGNAQYLLTPV